MSKRLRKYVFSSTGLCLGYLEVNPMKTFVKRVVVMLTLAIGLMAIAWGISHIPMPIPRVHTDNFSEPLKMGTP